MVLEHSQYTEYTENYLSIINYCAYVEQFCKYFRLSASIFL